MAPQRGSRPTARVPVLFSCRAARIGKPPRIGHLLPVVLFASIAGAAQGQTTGGSYTPPAGFTDFVSSAFYTVGLITACVVLVKQFRPQPAYNKQFAAIDHQHPELKHEHTTLLTDREHAALCDERRKQVYAEDKARRADIQDIEQRISAQIDSLRKDLFKALAGHNLLAEERASSLHQRINPMAERLSGVDAKIENHLQDHRSRKG